jgi:aspartate 1-decarboxylase
MLVNVLKSKIHRVTVTEANLDYIGSITIDEELMVAANIIENEQVDIYNITNGERFHTYVIKGEPGSGIIGINGAAAHKAHAGDLIIIASYAMMEMEEAREWHPTVIFPQDNKLVGVPPQVPES